MIYKKQFLGTFSFILFRAELICNPQHTKNDTELINGISLLQFHLAF